MRSALLASERLAASSCQTRDGIGRWLTDAFLSRLPLLYLLDLAPAAGPVVSNDLPEHLTKSAGIDLFVLAYGNSAGGSVVVTAGDDPLWIRNDRTVVEETFT